jgi:hypothetical protein
MKTIVNWGTQILKLLSRLGGVLILPFLFQFPWRIFVINFTWNLDIIYGHTLIKLILEGLLNKGKFNFIRQFDPLLVFSYF